MEKEKKKFEFGVSLGMPKLENPRRYVKGQMATCGGMTYCKGRIGEQTKDFEKNMWVHKPNHLGRRLARQVSRAKSELLRIQEIYIVLGKDPDLHNANYELQFSCAYSSENDPLLDINAYGYRTKIRYYGHSVLGVFRHYRIDLERKFADQLKQE